MKLRIYMKSGNQIDVTHVKEYNVKTQGNLVVSLSITRSAWAVKLPIGNHLLVSSVDLSQIEAVAVI